jgi:hypothetical protein
MTIRYAILAFSVLLTALPAGAPQQDARNDHFDLVDANGNIRKPAGYRDLYQALGVYTPVDLNNETQMHYTYASPGAAEYYRKNGKFADGTVLVKETFATESRTTRDDTRAIRCGAMDGDGRSTRPARLTNRSPRITGRTVWAVTSRRSPPTGYTCRVTRFSNQSSREGY